MIAAQSHVNRARGLLNPIDITSTDTSATSPVPNPPTTCVPTKGRIVHTRSCVPKVTCRIPTTNIPTGTTAGGTPDIHDTCMHARSHEEEQELVDQLSLLRMTSRKKTVMKLSVPHTRSRLRDEKVWPQAIGTYIYTRGTWDVLG